MCDLARYSISLSALFDPLLRFVNMDLTDVGGLR